MQRTIVLTDDGMFSSEPISVIELCNVFCAALTGAVQDLRPRYEAEPDAAKIDKELFDSLNYSFSKCLELTFPEYELHPELTEEVLKKEDELLRAKVRAIEDDGTLCRIK
jgi:hypothetical protein